MATTTQRRPSDAAAAANAETQAKRGARGLLRLGFAAKGVLYLLIAIIALRVALGGGGSPEDQEGALRSLRDEPFGTPLLVALVVGLIGYALWGLVEAIRGTESDGAMAVIERVGAVVRVVIYGGFAALAVAIVLANGSTPRGGGSPQDATAEALDLPLGRWLVFAVALVVIGVAGYDAYRAVTRKFLEDLDLETASRRLREGIAWLGSVGYAARALVYGLAGIFLCKAALEHDPEEAVGLDGALQRVASQSYGTTLLGLVAAGLLAYGLYALAEARYHHL